MSDEKRISDIELARAEGPCAEQYARLSRDVMERFQRVLCARTSAHPMGSGDREIYWDELEQELTHLVEEVRLRHAAKHYAVREAIYDVRPIVVVLDDQNTAALEAMNPDVLRELLGRKR